MNFSNNSQIISIALDSINSSTKKLLEVKEVFTYVGSKVYSAFLGDALEIEFVDRNKNLLSIKLDRIEFEIWAEIKFRNDLNIQSNFDEDTFTDWIKEDLKTLAAEFADENIDKWEVVQP